MGRSRAAPSTAKSHSAPAAAPKPAAPRAAPANSHATSAAPPRAQQQQPHTQQQQPHAPQPTTTNVYIQRGGGGGTGMLGTMAAVAGGSVLGHGISNYLYGNGQQAAPTQPAQAQELAQAAQESQHVCAPQLTGYAKCLENNADAEQCRWAWDYFQQCQQQKGPQEM